MLKTIHGKNAEGTAIVSKQSLSFFGGVDPKTGKVIDPESDIKDQIIKDKILVFKQGKGSTVGSYVLYRMGKKGTAPKAIIVEKAEPIIVVGCVLADISLFECEQINTKTGDYIKILNGEVKK